MVEESIEFSWSPTHRRRTLGWCTIIYIRTGVLKCGNVLQKGVRRPNYKFYRISLIVKNLH